MVCSSAVIEDRHGSLRSRRQLSDQVLTIGDGLVSQVPAFLISLAAGLLTTRSSSEVNLPAEFLSQLFSRPIALAVTAGFLGILTFTHSPKVPLCCRSPLGCAGLAMMITRKQRDETVAATVKAKAEEKKPAEERIEDYLSVDPMEIEIGVGVIRLADPKRGGDLLQRVQRVRQNVAAEIGILMPKVRIRDNMRLDQNQYRIKVADMSVAEGVVFPNLLLAMDSGLTSGKINGMPTKDPAFGTPAVWIDPGQRDQAEMLGYTVVEPVSVVATHLTEVVRKHADEILTRDATKHLVNELKQSSPAVVDELIPGQMKLAEVQQILQLLLREQVPIRQLGPILETLGDYARAAKIRSCWTGIRPPSPGPYHLHTLSRCRRAALRRHARSGDGRPNSCRLRAQRARPVHPHVATGG